jgi:hypothetical protein
MGNVVALKKARAAPHLLQLKIELAGIRPLIWRRVVLPETVTLPKLHQVIQVVMGWQDCHLHEFEIAGERYGIPDPDYDLVDPLSNEQRVRLASALGAARSFSYLYDYGDNWIHRIKVERRIEPDPLFDTALCVTGANAAPPDDVGGAHGYADLSTPSPTRDIPNIKPCSTGSAQPSTPLPSTSPKSIDDSQRSNSDRQHGVGRTLTSQ